KEEPVLLDRPSQRYAKHVVGELRRFVGQAAAELRLFQKRVVRAENRVAVVFVGRAVKVVGAALGHQRDLGSTGIAGVGVGVGGGDPEFLDGIRRNIQDTGKSVTIILVVNPDTIQRNVRLVAAQAI